VRWFLTASLVLGGPSPGASASEPPPRPTWTGSGLEALLEDFSTMTGLSARFREERRLALLEEPLVSQGVVYFAPPDRLVRHVGEPLASTFLVQGSEISFGSTDEVRNLDLAASPVLRSLVDGIRLVLAGDVGALRESFRIDFESGAAAAGAGERRWRILLEPLQASARDAIASISFSGRGRTPTELRVVERGGDETVTTFSEVRADLRFSEEELATLFRVPPR